MHVALLFLIIFGSETSAQAVSGIGVKGGINLARISESGTPPGKTDFVTRYTIGAYSEMAVFESLFFRYELLYSVRGTSRSINSGDLSTNGNNSAWNFTTTRKLTYIEPGLLIHFPIMRTEQTRFHVFTGASLAMNIQASSTVEGLYSGEQYYEHQTDRDLFLPIDPGLIIGAGIGYNFNPVHLTVDIRYIHGLMNIRDRGASDIPDVISDNDDIYGIPKMHNRTISFMLGLGI